MKTSATCDGKSVRSSMRWRSKLSARMPWSESQPKWRGLRLSTPVAVAALNDLAAARMASGAGGPGASPRRSSGSIAS
eukprot:1753957-Pyramimonas_sp.AAC.1